jgi:hypothetical protein
MAKSDTFFIRAKVQTNGTDYAETEIDLGAFVSLGQKTSTIMRIHSVTHQWADATSWPGQANFDQDANTGAVYAWQLCTQSQSALIYMDDKSVIASGQLIMENNTAQAGNLDLLTDVVDVAPQRFTEGYLVGVESLHLGVDCSIAPSNATNCCIMMEVSLEKATQATATALALSQQ